MTAMLKINIEELVKIELPPLPGPAMHVATLINDINSSAYKIAQAIGNDPVLATKVLRIANSPIYGYGRPITSLPMAVTTLGDSAIYQLIISITASSIFTQKGVSNFVEKMLWKHSLIVGLLAREISIAFGMQGSEEAFLCGLIHDIGKLLLFRYDQESYARILNTSLEQEMLEQERNTYGYDHAQVGALVAHKWQLPSAICNAICFHHNPGQAEQAVLMTRIVDLADNVANRSGYSLRNKKPLEEQLPIESLMALDLKEDQLNVIWEKAHEQMDHIIHVL